MKYLLMKYAYEQHDFELLLELFLQIIHVDPSSDTEKKNTSEGQQTYAQAKLQRNTV